MKKINYQISYFPIEKIQNIILSISNKNTQ